MSDAREAIGLNIERLAGEGIAIIGTDAGYLRLPTAKMRVTLYTEQGDALYFDLTRDGFTDLLVHATDVKCDA